MTFQDEYFEWLCDLVQATQIPARSYLQLMCILHNIPFNVTVPNDINRAEDGKALRETFYDMGNYRRRIDRRFLNEPCSILEMIVAISHRMDFTIDGEADINFLNPKYFWEILRNMNLAEFDDASFIEQRIYNPRPENLKIREITDKLEDLNRKKGGFAVMFPLKRARMNPQKIELWYLMQAYLHENHQF